MISKSKQKLIKSLGKKKYRIKENLFLTEGDKNVTEVLNSAYTVRELFATDDFLRQYKEAAQNAKTVTVAIPEEIKKASLLQNPQNCLALCEIPEQENSIAKPEGLAFYLDGIQDPGNLGTIIRTCDWFGITTVFCSQDTVDVYNPKVIQATMGSFCRVRIIETDTEKLTEFIHATKIPVYGTFMEGRNIYSENLPENALVILGNEGSGVRPETEKMITKKISIPSFSKSRAESLNVAIAAGIICSEFKRRGI